MKKKTARVAKFRNPLAIRVAHAKSRRPFFEHQKQLIYFHLTGTGVPTEVKEKLWDLFKRKKKGKGLTPDISKFSEITRMLWELKKGRSMEMPHAIARKLRVDQNLARLISKEIIGISNEELQGIKRKKQLDMVRQRKKGGVPGGLPDYIVTEIRARHLEGMTARDIKNQIRFKLGEKVGLTSITRITEKFDDEMVRKRKG